MLRKRKLMLLIALVVIVASITCILIACNDKDVPPYYGTYTGSFDNQVKIDENGFYATGIYTTDTLECFSYTVYDDRIVVDYGELGEDTFYFKENHQVLSANIKLKDSFYSLAENIQSRNSLFSARYIMSDLNWNIVFYNDGSFLETIDNAVSSIYRKGTYTVKDGVVIADTTNILTGVKERQLYYINDLLELENGVLVKDINMFIPESSGATTPSIPDNTTPTEPNDTTEVDTYFEITYTAQYGGSIEGIKQQTVKQGESATTVKAVPVSGYKFTGWSDGVQTAERTDLNIQANAQYQATFARFEMVTLSYYIATGSGSIQGGYQQEIEKGTDGTEVIAVPAEGYYFERWSDGVLTASRTDLNVQADVNVSAIFGKISEFNYGGGSGTVDKPYIISTVTHLNMMYLKPDANYKLSGNIELPTVLEGQSNFKPLFSDETMFNGTLDGSGYTISNLTIYNTETFYTGLFACISETATIKNLKLENANLQGTNYIGGVAGYCLGTIIDCEFQGIINYLSLNEYQIFIGGIVGRADGLVNNCSAIGNITIEDGKSKSYTGGIVGQLNYSGKEEITYPDCSVTININSKDFDVYAGGLIGNSYHDLTLNNSYATGDVSISSNCASYAGGLIGNGSNVTMDNSYSTGDISGHYAGGLFGYAYRNIRISNSYATGVVNSSDNDDSYIGGLVGFIDYDVSISNSYATGDVSSSSSYSSSYVGGLVGGIGDDTSISNSYATGDVSSSSSYSSSYVGGLVGGGHIMGTSVTITISNSYATGDVSSSSSDSYSYVGGLIGKGNMNIKISNSYATGDLSISCSNAYAGGLVGYNFYGGVTISNSYAVSKITVLGEDKIHKGGLVGYVGNISMTNSHWLYYAESGIDYAVGYSDSLGVPTNIGATKHTALSDFYSLAETLNTGLETAIWENKTSTSLPTLKKEEN